MTYKPVASRKIDNVMKKARAQQVDYLLTIAVTMTVQLGYTQITGKTLADVAGVPYALVRHYFTSDEALKDAVLQQAIDTHALQALGQLIVSGDPRMFKIPKELSKKAILNFLNLPQP